MPEAKIVTIDRNTWNRGFCYAQTSRLYDEEGYKCCLGFEALADGITKEQILNMVTPARLLSHRPEINIPGDFNWLLILSSLEYKDNSPLARAAIIVNDARLEARKYFDITLKDIFEHLELEVTFETATNYYIKIKSENQREELITKIFARGGKKVEFIN